MAEEKQIKPAEPNTDQVGKFLEQLFTRLGSRLERQDKFEELYANNFNFEPSVWDLKIVFGQLEQHTGSSVVDWHTAITIPWLQVNLVAYFLRVQAVWHDIEVGPIKVPAHLMPQKPTPPTGEAAKDPRAIVWYEAAKKIYEEMFPG